MDGVFRREVSDERKRKWAGKAAVGMWLLARRLTTWAVLTLGLSSGAFPFGHRVWDLMGTCIGSKSPKRIFL